VTADLADSLAAQELAALEELAALKAKLARIRGRGIAQYVHDPLGFIGAAVKFKPGGGLAPYQAEIIADLPRVKRMAVRGPRGLGKSALVSLIVLWFALTRDAAGIDWKIGTTAGSWAQLESYLWPEITKWSNHLNWTVIGREPLSPRSELMKTQMRLRHGLALAASPEKPAVIEGLHADSVLIVIDEAKIVNPGIFDSIEGAFSGAGDGSDLEAYALAFSTPGEPAGRFYDIHTRKPGLEDWQVRHVTLDEAIAAGRMTRQWAVQRMKLWGENSALYQNHVLGEFCADDEDAVIPLRWIEAAFERWRQWERDGCPDQDGMKVVGVDVARSGQDKSGAAIRHGNVITRIVTWSKEDTMATTGRVKGIMAGEPESTGVIDVIGIGAGVYDRLREMGLKVDPFNAGRRTHRKDKTSQFGFFNMRSWAWWNLREMLEPPDSELALPPLDELAGDLTAMHYKYTSDGKIQVESKDEIRKRIGRSTDLGDMVMQACSPSAGSWADAYGVTGICSKCDQMFRPDLPDGKMRTHCPHCKAKLEDLEDEAALSSFDALIWDDKLSAWKNPRSASFSKASATPATPMRNSERTASTTKPREAVAANPCTATSGATPIPARRSPRAGTSTTTTTTRSITTLVTSSCVHPRGTPPSIPRTRECPWSTSTRSAHLPPNGIAAPRASNGTGSTASTRGTTANPSTSRSAPNAAGSSRLSGMPAVMSATARASAPTAPASTSTWKPSPAPSAAPTSSVTVTRSAPKPVPVSAGRLCAGSGRPLDRPLASESGSGGENG
jgi:hypothetical protein